MRVPQILQIFGGWNGPKIFSGGQTYQMLGKVGNRAWFLEYLDNITWIGIMARKFCALAFSCPDSLYNFEQVTSMSYTLLF